jgi:probable rRNA maturation factor
MAVFVADEQSDVDVDGDRLRRLACHVLADQGVPEAMEVSVLCVGADAIEAMNRAHMGADGPTDVLAFPLDHPGEPLHGEVGILGDVVLCPSVAAAQAAEHGKTAQQEIELLVVHGLLHLLGHDHAEEEERAVMFGLTDRLLADFAAVEAQP